MRLILLKAPLFLANSVRDYFDGVFAKSTDDLAPWLERLPAAVAECRDFTVGSWAIGEGACVVVLRSDFAMSRLKEHLARDPASHVVAFYLQPVEEVALSLKAGAGVVDALDDCHRSIKDLLALFRSARTRITMVHASVLGSPARLAEALGLSIDLPGQAWSAEPPDAISTLLAKAIVEADIGLSGAAGQIEAASKGTTAAEPTFRLEDLVAAWDGLLSDRGAVARAETLADALEAATGALSHAKQQIAELQELCESRAQAVQQAQDEAARHAQRVEMLEGDLGANAVAAADAIQARAAAARLEAALALQGREMTAAEEKLRELSAALAMANQMRLELRGELDAIEQAQRPGATRRGPGPLRTGRTDLSREAVLKRGLREAVALASPGPGEGRAGREPAATA
ncbi:hypothetical protein [Aquabacter spiritensis]|uniref:Uncharacterized protein n=1 Tax=Aquabacter spiritensis TaxID=933073 RepID=A0A4R3LU63_9HYPH|nr:hypothetical protein [Aquabacter spiritensis]TCT04011.1 hypothetical protein EDC64_108177 [Aquabacter spiritensis]